MAGNTVGSARIELVPDLTGFHKQASREIRQMPDLTADVELVPDVDHFRSEAQRELKKAGPIQADVRLDVDGGQARRDVRKIEKTIPDVNVGVDADTGAASAKITAMARPRKTTLNVDADTGAATAQMGVLGASVAAVGTAATFAGHAVRTIGNSAVVSGIKGAAGITLISGAILGLIGLVGIAAGVIGILGVGLLGLGAAAIPALGAIAIGMEGIKNAAMEAKAGFDELKSAMTSTLEESMKPGFAALGEVMSEIIPQAQNVGRAFGEVFTGISTLIRDDLMGELRTMMDGMATFIRELQPGLETMTIGFMNLGAVFGENAAAIGAGFGEMLGHLGAVFTRLESMGTLQALFESLGPILASTGALVGGLVEALALAGQVMAPFVAPLLDAMTAVLPGLGIALGAVGAAISQVLIALMPILTPLSDLLIRIAPVLASTMVPVAEALVGIVEMLAPILAQFIETMAPVISDVLLAVGDVIVALMPVIQVVVDLMGQMAPIFTQIVEVLAGVLVSLAPALQSLFEALAPIFPVIAQAILDLVTALAPLMPQLAQLVIDLMPVLGFVIEYVIIPAIQFLAWFIIPFLVLAFQGVIDTIRKVVDWIVSVKDWWIRLGGTLKEFGLKVGEMSRDVRAKGEEVIGWFRDLPGKIKGWLSDAGSWLVDTGKNLIDGLVNGIKSAGSAVKDAILALVPDAIEGPIKKALGIQSPSRLMMEVGAYVGEGLAIGMEDQIPVVQEKGLALAAAADPSTPVGATAPTADPQIPAVTPQAPVAGLALAAGPVDPTGMAEAVQAALGGVAAPAWENYAATVQSVQSGLLAPATAAAAGAVSSMAGSVGASLGSANASVTNTGNVMASTVNGRMIPTWQNAGNQIRNVQAGPMETAFRETRNSVNYTAGTFGPAADNISVQWGRLREGTAAPVRWSIQNVFNDGVVGSWNAVSDLLGTKKMNQYPVRFATGGEVPGQGNTDKVPALLMPGEFVFRKSVVQKLGIDNLKKINEGKDPQGALPNMHYSDVARRFAAGGLVKGAPGWEAIKRGYDWARSRSGRPYVFGGSAHGGGGTDCSGYMSGIANAVGGGDGRRQWATGAFHGQSPGPQGFIRGLNAGFAVGIVNGGPAGGHTAGTIGGLPGLPAVNVESGGAHNYVSFGGPAVGADHSQFPMKYHLPIVGDQVFVSGGGGGGDSMASLVSAQTDPIWKAVSDKVAGANFPGMTQPIPKGYMDSFKKATDAKIQKLAEALTSFADPGGAGVQRWRPMVELLLKRYRHSLTNTDLTLRRMNQESGGNPRAINNWDSNAKAGTPSKGLMQVIDPTFAAHRDPALSADIWDPMANVAASMRYAVSRYGSLASAYNRPGGYDAGGWLDPGISTIYNGFTKPEAILSPAESERFVNIADAFLDANMAGGSFVGQHVENQWVVDPDEVQAKSRRGVRRAMKEAGIR